MRNYNTCNKSCLWALAEAQITDSWLVGNSKGTESMRFIQTPTPPVSPLVYYICIVTTFCLWKQTNKQTETPNRQWIRFGLLDDHGSYEKWTDAGLLNTTQKQAEVVQCDMITWLHYAKGRLSVTQVEKLGSCGFTHLQPCAHTAEDHERTSGKSVKEESFFIYAAWC